MKRIVHKFVCSVAVLATLAGASSPAHAASLAPPATPTTIFCQGYERDTVAVSWRDQATDETAYRVERSIGGAAFSEVTTLPADSSSYNDTHADVSTQNRRYRVRAFRAGDNTFSDYSPICNNRRIYETDHFRIFYGVRGTGDDCPQVDGNDVCLADVNDAGVNTYVKRAADSLEGSVAAFPRLGFTHPAGVHGSLDKIPINVVWCDSGGCAGGGGLGLSPYLLEMPFDVGARTGDPIPYLVAEHESFHFQQYKYGGLTEPDDNWVYEGQARLSQDKVCIGGDRANCNAFDDISTGYAGYVPEINGYLSNTNGPINRASYGAALFWAYLTEKYGTSAPTDTVENGMNLLAKFWEASDSAAGRDGITVLNQALGNMGYAAHFRDIWKDFAVSLYAKDITGSGVPVKYKFADMSEPGGSAYAKPTLRINQALNLNDNILKTGETVYQWAANFYEIQPAANVPVIPIKVVQDSSHPLYYAILGIKNNNLTYLETVEARNLDRTLVNNGYDKVAVVVAGLDNLANYRVSFNGTQPVLHILRPTNANKASVGSNLAPDKFLATAEVLAGDGTPLGGVDLGQFSFTVGAQPVIASSIVASSTVQGQQWFVLRAPGQTSPGQYDFTVRYGGILTATETAAVDYTPRNAADSVLIIDRSGSMAANNKLVAAQAAARLYVDSWKTGDKIGVESFNTAPTVDMTVRDWTDAPSGGSRQQAFTAITGFTAAGGTDIGDALIAGWNELKTRANTSHDWALVLLSDGKEEDSTPTRTFDQAVGDIANAPAGTKKPVIHAVAVGPDADGPRMQNAADATGGTYQFVSIPSAVSAASANSTTAVDLRLNLDSKYRYIATKVLGRQQIYNSFGPLNDQARQETHTIPVEKGAAELVLSLSWTSGTVDAVLRDPDDTIIPPFELDFQHRVWRTASPKAGNWTLQINQHFQVPGVAAANAPAAPDASQQSVLPPYYVQAAIKSNVTLDTFLGTPVAERKPGAPMPILAMLTDNGPVTGALVTARVEKPDASVTTIRLYDDGAHGDGSANDGLYANNFYQTGQLGNYNVTVNANGTSALNGAFTRQDILSFYLFATNPDNPDRDHDGLPDDWEVHYGTNPDKPDAQADPDSDGLPNSVEWQNGTDPHNADTDGGGEADSTDPNPLDPSDDRIQPTWVVAEPGISKVYLKYVTRPDYATVNFFRSEPPDTIFKSAGSDASGTGVFTDTNVTNDKEYCYIAVAVGKNGARSATLNPSCATPKADPVPPHGLVVINDGANKTATPAVKLTLFGSDSLSPESEAPNAFQPNIPQASASGVKEMMISNRGDMADGVWEPYATTKPWTLGVSAGLGSVYVKYRDNAGNESPVVAAGILVDPNAPPTGQQIYLPLITR